MTAQVVFACVHNAGRSQIAAAFFNALANPKRARAVSAGTEPADRVHPEVVTMGCGEACPFVPGLKRDDWPIEDPKGKPLERVRKIRDEIRQRVERLIDKEGWRREG